MEFCKIKEKVAKRDTIEIYPDFVVGRNSDLMVRGKAFYAVWDEEAKIWSRNALDTQHIVDRELEAVSKAKKNNSPDSRYNVKYMREYSSGSWDTFMRFLSKAPDNFKQLDEKVTFASTEVSKNDHVSKRLPYDLRDEKCEAYEELVSTLYSAEERHKLEWAIGSVLAGDSKNIQKFIVLYGEGGSGKSTMLNIIEKLFEGYTAVFNAKELTGANNQYVSGAIFNNDPLVAIQHDGDLSNIKDNSKLNSIVSHEIMDVNEKYKSQYSARCNAFLFMGTNKPVKITDAKSGIIRRLIDVKPSGNKVQKEKYDILIDRIDFELGAIANHCLKVYKKAGKNYYNGYRPMDMMDKTDYFFNFVQDNIYAFTREEYVTLKSAYALYKEYCVETSSEYILQRQIFREELKNYFKNYYKDYWDDNRTHLRNVYTDFRYELFTATAGAVIHEESKEEPKNNGWIKMDNGVESVLDKELSACPAQYANQYETPGKSWDKVKTRLSDLDTSKLHYILPKNPNHIMIDFDLKDENGKKSYELNVEAASKFPPTYAETSKSGEGIHLHYIYDGDVDMLSRLYDDNIEIKVFTGNSSIRRKLIKCNDLPIAHISTGLPLRGESKKMIFFENVTNEKAIRTIIIKNLRKEYHPNTKPSIDFIHDTLEKAYNSGLKYDVSDLQNDVLAFAMNSSNKSDYCVKLVTKMKFKSEEPSENKEVEGVRETPVFYDIEVFPNLFIVCWKLAGDHAVVPLINPSPAQIEDLMKYKLIGFNNRKYDNHILYAAMMGYSNEQLFRLSQKIIEEKKGFFGEAYNLSYTDVYDFASEKMSLKKWEIKLGIHHQENNYPWDQPVPEDKWIEIADYCCNDVIATEAVYNHRHADFLARQILADVAAMTVNDTTNSLTTRIIFGRNKKPQNSFNYRFMGEDESFTVVYKDGEPVDGYTVFGKDGKPIFPGYKFEGGKSTYRGEDVGEGGYVYAEPGMYGRVVTLDVASMHPSSIIAEMLFGPEYTARFQDLLDARLAIKHKDFEKAKTMLGGVLAKYLDNPDDAKVLSQALKIAINSVYGLTTASFENPFRDPRNIDNIVAKRGALFMINLKHEVQKRGYTVVHIKTDSIKIADPSQEILDFVMDYGKQYGYNFEIEHIFERICLVNDAVYIGKLAEDDPDEPGEWTATGTQFAVPYVFKTLFSHEDITFEDMCETKSTNTALYLDMNEGLSDLPFDDDGNPNPDPHNYIFVGKVGAFTPVKEGTGGGELLRLEKDGRYSAATGTKGYRWMESEMVKKLNCMDSIDKSYYTKLVDNAIDSLSEFGDVERFLSDDSYEILETNVA